MIYGLVNRRRPMTVACGKERMTEGCGVGPGYIVTESTARHPSTQPVSRFFSNLRPHRPRLPTGFGGAPVASATAP